MPQDEAVEFVGDGAVAGAADEFAVGERRVGLQGLFLDLIKALDEPEDREGWLRERHSRGR